MTGRDRRWTLGRACTAVVALTLATGAHAGHAPEWLERAAAVSVPPADAHAAAVNLLDEQAVVLDDNGTAHLVRRKAVRVLSAEGRSAAIAWIPYETSSAKVNDIQAWILRPGGHAQEMGSDRNLDMALVNGDVFNEARIRSIVATDQIQVGETFGWECRLDQRSMLREFEWSFQDALPSLCSRLTIDAPSSWTVKAVAFNHAPIEPLKRGTAWTWELRDLPGIPDEPMRPPITSLIPRLAVSAISPSRGVPSAAFEQWDSLAAWLSDLAAVPSRPDAAVTAKAHALTGSLRARDEKVRAVARFIQGIPYASIQMGNGRGGGYQPHPSGEVLTRYYGDCKDKANLMCCMLRSLGIPAYLVAVYSSDRAYVREDWPAAQQFNHCIVAVAADSLRGPIVDHPRLGQLLLFDPTDTNTPLGDLPIEEQGGAGILMVREPGALIRLPILPAERNRMERTNEVTLTPDGSIHGTIRERSWGSVATLERSFFQSLSAAPYRDRVQAWVALSAPRAVVSGLRAEPMDSTGAFELNLEYAAERYAQAMDRLLLLRPTFVERWEEVPSSDTPRTTPVDIEEQTCRELTKVHLPAGVTVDEVPEAVHLETSFGSYRWEVESNAPAGEIRVRREIRMHRATLAPDQYPAVRSFYERVRAAEQARIVLAKTGG
ncbi:MAG TPA: DUF3857 domain-containing protein [Candidatus Binatia bacterium]|nr:DUF3857 domain-containing protein [Candidatus Binatia bacterium]